MDSLDVFILSSIEKDTVSGQQLAESAGISRTAVWKRIKKLEELGYKIKKSKKGYKLAEKTPYLLENEVKPFLKTRWLGKNYIHFFKIDSTNRYAKENDLPDGTVVVAEEQTAGKGRRGRRWVSVPEKGLYFSIVLKRKINPALLPVFSLVFPLSVRETLERKTGLPIKVKWPNDLYIKGRKTAGFLIETELEGNQPVKITVGIGINVSQTEEELSPLGGTATSLFIESKTQINRKELLGNILTDIENSIENFSPDSTVFEINKNLLWKGEKVFIPDEGIEGTLIEINSSGGAVIETAKGRYTVFTGDISLRKKEA
ncbi:biotin--[acetyl-CoA-carboxylase] ligase [Persephonella sp.]